MPELNTFTCDVCGARKREVNHWWIVSIEMGVFLCREFDEVDWRNLNAELKRHQSTHAVAVACGEEHAQMLFDRWLHTRTFDAPRRES